MRQREIAKGVCTGCGRPAEGPTAPLVAVKVFGQDVVLHEGRAWVQRDEFRNGDHVSATCLRRVREKLAKCPGCFAADQEPGTLCKSCLDAIARDREANQQAMKVYRICTSYILGPYAGGEHQRAIEKAARLLARAVAGRRFWSNGSPGIYDVTGGDIGREHGSALAADPCVELTTAQADALREFSGAIGKAMEAQYDAGKEEGRNILLGLARGEMTTADYEERIERRKRR